MAKSFSWGPFQAKHVFLQNSIPQILHYTSWFQLVFEGSGLQMDIFWRPSKSKLYLLNMRKWFLNFQPGLLNRKINVFFLLASLKTLSNSKDCSLCRIKFLFRFSFILTGGISPLHIHSRLFKEFSESQVALGQLLESQAASRKPEPGP